MSIQEPKGMRGLRSAEETDKLRNLRGWNELSSEEQEEWYVSHPEHKKHSPLKMSIIYRNNRYYDELGEDAYNKYDIETLGKLYEDKVVGDAFKDYYGKDAAYGDEDSIGELQLLTTNAKKSLLESGVLNDEDAAKEVESYREVLETKKNSFLGKLKEAYEQSEPAKYAGTTDIDNQVDEYSNLVNSGRRGAIEKAIAESNKEKIESSQEDIDQLYSFYKNGQEAWTTANTSFKSLFSGEKEATNKDISDVIEQMASGFLITKEQGAKLNSLPTEQKVNFIGQILETSEFNPARIDKMFDQIALPRDVEYTSDFTDEVQSYQLPGSRTYKALKDTDRFSNFGSGDKLREYLTWQVLAQKYGTGDAISALETDMTRYAKDNESFKEWISDVHTNVVLGGIANIMNKVNAISNIGVAAQGQEALANVLSGKNADGSIREQRRVFEGDDFLSTMGNAGVWFWDNAFNPRYWSKVDEYNTFDPFMIEEIDANGGISPFVTTRLPDEPLKFFSTDTLKEALKMSKFVWSDYLVGQVLGAATRGAASLGTRISPGLGRGLNIAGAYGTVAASGMGIAESYGVMTYDQTYQEMMEALNKRENTAAAQAATEARNNPEYKKQIDEVVARKVREQELATAGEENPLKLSEEEIRKQVEADFNNYYIKNVWNEDPNVKAAHDDWEKLAKRAAANAYMVDATIEEIRMAASNFAFRKYLFDSGTLSALGDNSKKYANVVAKSETELMEGSSKAWNRASAVIKPFWGGFQSNYFDDVTVAFGKGFGLGQYNSWLQNKYDPRKAVAAEELPMTFIEGLDEALSGAKTALSDRQSFYDGFVGALGSFTSLLPRLTTAERNTAMENMNRKEGDQLTAGQKINRLIMNPLLDAYYTAKGNEERTAAAIPTINKVIKDKKDALENIIGSVVGLNSVAEANQSGSKLDRKTAKENQAFQLLYSLDELDAAPLVSEVPLVQNARQEIDRLAKGQITDEDIAAYRSQPGNRNATVEEARDRLQKNAKSLKEMSRRISDSRQVINGSIVGRELDKDLKEQLIYQLSMDDAWSNRLSEMEKEISKGSKPTNSHSAVAAYGNAAEYERHRRAHASNLARLVVNKEIAKDNVAKAAELLKAAEDGKSSPETIKALEENLMQEQLALQTIFETIREARAKAKELDADGKVFKNDTEVEVLSSEEILRLNPEERATILNEKNRKNYSEEQQVQIDKALAELKTKNPDAESLIADAAALYTRVRDNKVAYRRMLTNPEAATAYVESIKASRAIKALNVIAEARVDEVYKKWDSAQSNDELREFAKMTLNSKEYGINSARISAYIMQHPEKKEVLQGFYEVAKVREDTSYAIKSIIRDRAAVDALIKESVLATLDSTNEAEAMTALEGIVDMQPSSEAKLQIDRVLEKVKELGHQRDATKLRDRNEEKRLREEEEKKRSAEEAKKDGKNYDWEGYKVGDTVYNKKTGSSETVIGFEKTASGTNQMVSQVTYADGTTGILRYSSAADKSILTKEKPSSKTATETKELGDNTKGNSQQGTARGRSTASSEQTRRGDKQVKRALKDLEEAKTATDKANAIAFYDTAKYRGAEVTAEEEAKVEQAREELKKEGYEVVDMLGKPYNDGMKVTANFITDSSLAPGETKIIGVTKPQINKDGKMVQSAEIIVAQSPIEVAEVADVDIQIDSEGGVASPSAAQQAASRGQTVIDVPKTDTTDQGNAITTTEEDVLSGNKWVEYKLESLKNGVVELITADEPNSVFGRFLEWLKGHKDRIKLQEIIDEEFGKILQENPDIDVRFMTIKTDKGDELGKVLVNVIEMTPEVRKHHKDSRGGVITANGKSWLVVGTTGFNEGATTAQRVAYDKTRGFVNKRGLEYFKQHPEERYYVDPTAYTRVQNTTSGRIINQALGSESPRLKKISELLKSAGMSLKDAKFGIQTAQAGNKSFAVSKNVKNPEKVFPPKNREDNKGRTFILLETPNGNMIPGMIEAAMLNNIPEDSQLRDMIYSTIYRLFSTNYETRAEAIKELCGYLVLGEDKNILIGTKDINNITIKRAGMPDITQQLGKNFDSAKFLKDIEESNFQINITLNTLEDSVMLKMYDDAGALMTTIDSMKAVGMSYNLYAIDSNGKPIINTPVGNAVPGTGTSEIKQTTSVRVSNVTYDLKGDKFVNRYTGEEVSDLGSPLYISCYYNYIIKTNGLTPIATQGNKQFFQVTGRKGDFIITRDATGNIDFMTLSESREFMSRIQEGVEKQRRAENLEEVDLYGDVEEEPITPTGEPTDLQDVQLTDEQITQQALGNFESPAPEVKPQPQSETITEAQASQPTESKEVITDIGTKSLEELQKQENLSTFEEILDSDYMMPMYEILQAKGWGITGDFAKDAEILKAHGVTTTGITNIESWLDMIKNCK